MSKTDDVMLAIGRLQGAIEEGFKNTDANFARINGSLGKQDGRIRTLETFKDQAAGKITVIASIFGFCAAILGAWITSWMR